MITFFIMKGKKLIGEATNVAVMPRIGEKIEIAGRRFRVKNVIWRFVENQGTYADIQVQ